MKTIIIVMSFLSAGTGMVSAQNFSVRTNDIHPDFRNPAATDVPVALPFITWTLPRLEYSNSSFNDIEIQASVSSDVDIKSITILVGDGDKTRGEKPLEIGTQKEYAIKQPIQLLNGHNQVDIVVETINGGMISSSRSILVGSEALATAVAVDRKDYALLFATDQYDNWADLVNPIDDAHGIAKILKEKYGFEVEIVENPNLDDVFIKLAEYGQRKFKPQDQLLIFFAGHGYFDENFGEGFVVAKNSLQNDRAKTSYISHNRLRGVVNNIPSEHIFLTMDVCFGGTFDPIVAGSRGSLAEELTDSEFLVRKLGRRTRKYLTSGGKEYVSDGVPGKHSPFTLKFMQALAGGEGSDHMLILSELKTYIEKLKSEPRMGSFGDDRTDSDFVFVSKE